MQADLSKNDELRRLERVAYNRNGLWSAIAITLLGLLLFVAVFNFLLPNFATGLDGLPLIILGLIFSLIPAALWLGFFYRMDRLEPEPKRMVFNIFLLGALVTAALLEPVLQGFFAIDTWLYSSWWAHLFGRILIIGFVQEFIVFAVVRYVMFPNPEFDERVDGVIYAIAAGLGLATVLNFQYVVRRAGVDLDIGSIRMVVAALAQASFAGLLGYFIGQARFEKVPVYYLPMGLSIAAVLNGLFFYFLDRSSSGALTYDPWSDLIFATIVASMTLAIVFWLIARANEETLRLARQAQNDSAPVQTDPPIKESPGQTGRKNTSLINALSGPSITNKPPTQEDIRHNDLYTIAWFLFALFLGFGISNNALTASTPVTIHDDVPTIDVPAGWIRGKLDGADLYAKNPRSASSFDAELSVSVRKLKEEETLPKARSGLAIVRGRELSRYRELDAHTATVYGEPALLVSYAFIADPTRAAGAIGPPVVAEGQDLLYVADGKLVVVSVAADATEWDAAMNDFRIIFDSLKFKESGE